MDKLNKSGFEFSYDWFSKAAPHWSKWLGPLKNKANLKYLEIGVFEGRSLCWMMENILTHASARAIGVDHFIFGLPTKLRQNLARLKNPKKVKLLKGPSPKLLKKLKDSQFDIIYIDGEHTLRGTLQDIVLSWPLLKPDGLMIVDDYQYGNDWPVDSRPKEAVDLFLTAFRSELEVLHVGYQVVIKRRASRLKGWVAMARFGSYLVDWELGQVFNQGGEVQLRNDEFQVIKRIFQSLQIGETEINMKLKIWNAKATKTLLRKLRVTRKDFLYAEIRNNATASNKSSAALLLKYFR